MMTTNSITLRRNELFFLSFLRRSFLRRVDGSRSFDNSWGCQASEGVSRAGIATSSPSLEMWSRTLDRLCHILIAPLTVIDQEATGLQRPAPALGKLRQTLRLGLLIEFWNPPIRTDDHQVPTIFPLVLQHRTRNCWLCRQDKDRRFHLMAHR